MMIQNSKADLLILRSADPTAPLSAGMGTKEPSCSRMCTVVMYVFPGMMLLKSKVFYV